jgi:hypothetical protein
MLGGIGAEETVTIAQSGFTTGFVLNATLKSG